MSLYLPILIYYLSFVNIFLSFLLPPSYRFRTKTGTSNRFESPLTALFPRYTKTMAEQQIAWVVHTHEHKERTPDWYWAAGLLSLVVVALSLFFGNLLFAAIIVLGVGS